MQIERQSDILAYERARNRVVDDKIFIFHEGVDFLTVRLDAALPLIRTLNGLVENSDTMVLEHGFRVVFFGLVAGSQLKVLHVTDSHSNLIAYIHIKQHSEKKNRNFFTDIEFTGLFWTAYADYLDYFLALFEVDRKKRRIVSRIDYCIDLAGIDVATLAGYSRGAFKNGHIYQVEDEITYRNYGNERHDLVIYNKRLDVLDKGKHKIIVDGADTTPNVRYHPDTDGNDYPITRVEYRLKSRALRGLADSSIDSLFKYAKQLCVDYFARYYNFDLGYVLRNSSEFERHGKPTKVDELTKKVFAKKLAFNWSMASAYIDNVEKLGGKRKLFRRLYDKLGYPLYAYGDKRYFSRVFEELSPDAPDPRETLI